MTADADKRKLLGNLTHALGKLAEQLRRQQGNAQGITLLATQAERIAEKATALNRAKPGEVAAAVVGLVDDIQAFARKVAEAAERAGREVLLGRQVAEAIQDHAHLTAELARNFDRFPDAQALRTMLRPLVTTLADLPQRMKADRAVLEEVDEISRCAAHLAGQATGLAPEGTHFGRAVVDLGRNLRQFAEHAATFSLKMQRDARLAIDVVERMGTQTAGLVGEARRAGPSATVQEGLMPLARSGSPDPPPKPPAASSAAPARPVATIPQARSRSWLT